MKKILSLTSIIFLLTVATPSYFSSCYSQNLKDDNPKFTIEPVKVDDPNLYTYSDLYAGTISISLTDNLYITRSGQLADKFSSIRLPNFSGNVYLFSDIIKTEKFNFSTNVIPYSAHDGWKSSKRTIIEKSENWGSAHIDGRILVNIMFSVYARYHIILSLNFYYSGTSWATQNWAHVSFNTGNVIEFVKR